VKILALSDQVSKAIYSTQICERFGDVDLVLSCGDLPYSYLEFVATMLDVPCLFVHGNHDAPEYTSGGQVLTSPGGWTDIDGRSVRVKGISVAGLEGSMRYKPRAPYQYTEQEMLFKALRLVPFLAMNRLRYGQYVDVLITHAPPLGIHDGKDWPHRGFRIFRDLITRFRPRYLLHGHKHLYGPETWRTRHQQTEVINVYPFRIIEFDPS